MHADYHNPYVSVKKPRNFFACIASIIVLIIVSCIMTLTSLIVSGVQKIKKGDTV
jgi:hypothetical protein